MDIANQGITTMSQDSQRPPSHSERLNQEVSDGGGCAETWEAMSEMREDSGRRDFLTHVGATLGVLATGGAAATMSAAAHEEEDGSDAEVEALRGRERGQLLRRANRSMDVRQVASLLGEKPAPTKVFEYTVDGDSGYGVTFGDSETEGTTIQYRSPSIDGDGVAHGGRPVGDGVRVVETKEGSMMSIGTQRVENVLSQIPDTTDASGGTDGTFAREQSILVQSLDESAFDLYVPVVRDDDVVDRVVFSAERSPAQAEPADFIETSGQTGDGVSTEGHVGCDPFGVVCTDYCTILCSSIAVGGGAACTAGCASTIVGLPLSLSGGCGAFCGALTGATCYQTCRNHTGHDVG